MVRSIAEFKDRHKGQTVWLIASGKSLDFVPRHFFDDKITIVVNEAHREWFPTYSFSLHKETAQEALDRGLTVVAPEWNQGKEYMGRTELTSALYDWWMFKHPFQPNTLVMDMRPFVEDIYEELCIGSNCITSALDFAGRTLGAKAVILCGVDGGAIDGQLNYEGYNGGFGTNVTGRSQDGSPHLVAQRSLLATVKDAMRSRGVAVMSLNPFVDFTLEGHVYAAF